MSKIAITFGVLLMILGVAGFVLTGSTHYTALIPVWFGIPMAIAGGIAMNPKYRMHAMHVAALLGVLGFAGTVPGVIKLAKWQLGTAPERPAAVISQSIMAVLMLVFVILCVNSFIAARRARQQAPGFPVDPSS